MAKHTEKKQIGKRPAYFLSIKGYLTSMILALLLLFPLISLLFWQQVSDFREVKKAEDIVALHESMKARSATLLRSMTLSANQAVTGYDFSFINLLMQQVVEADQEIQFCQVNNLDGIIVAHNTPALVGSKTPNIDKPSTSELIKQHFTETSKKTTPVLFVNDNPENPLQGKLFEVITPIHNGKTPWGVLRCGFSLQKLNKTIELGEHEWNLQLQQSRNFFLFLAIGFVIIGLVVAGIFIRHLLKATHLLANSVTRVSDGELDHQMNMKELLFSEFKTLAESFNKMTKNLASSRAKLDGYNRRLERKVKERTRDLEVSNKELESFNYSVSHDLRAPLRSIDGFSQILKDDFSGQLDKMGHDYLNRVIDAANRMEILIDDMLRLSRLSRLKMQNKAVNLSELAERSIQALRDSDPARTLECQIEADIMTYGDSALLAIMMDNLIGNAWKYTGKQTQASIEIGQTIQENKQVYYVRDNGVGFNMKYADKLFGAFQRLHKDSEFEGTGIGLATVARILNRHGGSIWAVSSVGKGATFYFQLPGVVHDQ